MSSDIAIYDEELRSQEDDVAACLRACDTLTGEARMEKVNKAADLIKKIGKTYHQLKYELRMLEGSEQQIYEKKAAEHQQQIGKLKTMLSQKRSEAPAGRGAQSPTSPTGGDFDERRNDGKDEARASTQRIGKIQNNTIDSLKRTAGMIDESENLGNEAAGTLKKQTDQMKENLEKLEVIEGQVDKAKKELNAFIRRMMTDKIILCFAILIILGIIAVVALKLTQKKDDEAPKPVDTPTPMPPTPPPPTPIPPTPVPDTSSPQNLKADWAQLAEKKQQYYKA